LVQLAWQDNSSNETLFYIERCVGSGCTNFVSFATQWPDVPNYTDYSAITGQSYSYRVRAYNAGGYSPYSNIASIVAGVVNQPPTAVMSAIPTSGAAPLAVNFSSSGTSDPDGSIVSYAWNFGDGGTSTLAHPSHTYQTAGPYIATLTVTDNQGATGTASVTITVTQGGCTNKCLRSTNIALSAQLRSGTVTATGQVTVKNETGAVVPSATVFATWTQPNGSKVNQTATTNGSGSATFKTSSGRGTYILTITNITKTGSTFDPANSVLSKSITR
jgi:PKD repeat protein